MTAETQRHRRQVDAGQTGQDETVLEWVRAAARGAAAKTDAETVVLDVGAVLSIVNWFVITSGRNSRQVKSLADEVKEKVSEIGGPKPIRVEGLDSCNGCCSITATLSCMCFTTTPARITSSNVSGPMFHVSIGAQVAWIPRRLNRATLPTSARNDVRRHRFGGVAKRQQPVTTAASNDAPPSQVERGANP